MKGRTDICFAFVTRKRKCRGMATLGLSLAFFIYGGNIAYASCDDVNCNNIYRNRLVDGSVYSLQGLRQVARQQGKRADTELLGKALDYFTSKKYHECLLILQELVKHYRLNPRYKAYLGVCFYYEWDYKNAVKYLGQAIPQLVNFAPHERSFYYWAEAESYFNLQKYDQAIPSYLTMLTLCYDNEKPDAYYRLGFCYMFGEDWGNAWQCFRQALEGYECYRPMEQQARIAQVKNMLKALDAKVVKLILSHIGIDKAEGD